MNRNTPRTLQRASVLRLALVALAPMGLVLLGAGAPARADDVKVQPAPGSGFVVTDKTGATERFKVTEGGAVSIKGLVDEPAQGNIPLCFNATTGQIGACVGGSGTLVDNGDGTVTDGRTGLMWERKTGAGGASVDCSTTTCSAPHIVNNAYKWCLDANSDFTCDNPGNPPDGGAFTDFLAKVNSGAGLGGHSDWRVPTIAELQTIVDVTKGNCGGGSGACISPVFGPTVSDFYWSASTFAESPDSAWIVSFVHDISGPGSKTIGHYVRAVRGGL
jgi:hypothetical protein